MHHRIGCALFLLLPGLASATPQTLHHSGRALDVQGVPLQGNVTVVATLWTTPTAEQSAWTDTFEEVPVVDGYYNVILGTGSNPLDTTDIDDTAMWLEIAIDGVSTGRQPLTSVPYALVAERSLDTPAVSSGTFTPTMRMYSSNCNGPTTVTAPIEGHWYKTGPLVHVTLTGLPTGASHPYHCMAEISGLPFVASQPAALSFGHARGIQFKFNTTVHTNFTMSAEMNAGSDTVFLFTSHQSSAFTGFWYINGNSTGAYVHSISGTYLTDE